MCVRAESFGSELAGLWVLPRRHVWSWGLSRGKWSQAGLRPGPTGWAEEAVLPPLGTFQKGDSQDLDKVDLLVKSLVKN